MKNNSSQYAYTFQLNSNCYPIQSNPITSPKMSMPTEESTPSQHKLLKSTRLKPLSAEMCFRAKELFQEGCSVANVSRYLQLSAAGVRRMKKEFMETEDVKPVVLSQVEKNKLDDIKNYEKNAIKNMIMEIIKSNCARSLGSIREELVKRGVYRHHLMIRRLLKEMKYTRKRLRKIPIEKNSKEKLIYRQKYCLMIKDIPTENLIFMDETHFNQHTSIYYGWAPKGDEPSMHIPAQKKKNVSLIAAISIRGFQATMIIRGPVNQKHICEFLMHQLDHLQPHQVLVLDNARVHHSHVVKETIREMDRPIRYLPAYTPQLNPIEMVFGELKANFFSKRNSAEIKLDEMVELVEESVKEMKSKEFKNYFRHYNGWVDRGIQGELFI